MDNLTHSLAGVLLGQMGLKRLTGRAMPALVIAANIPDLDAFATLLGTQSLAIRRGLTHGPLALLLLPLALTAVILAWDRWRPSERSVRPGMLLLLAFIGTLSHPALDWLNSYGVRLLEPFSSRWYAGDTLFIIDIWIWAGLIISLLLAHREERSGGDWRRPAWIGFVAISVYILVNGLITGRAERSAEKILEERGVRPLLVVANPVPVRFWVRRILWHDPTYFGHGEHHFLGETYVSETIGARRLDHPLLNADRRTPDAEAFLFWSRMPIVVERGGGIYLADQRFNSSLTRRTFMLRLR